MNNQYIITHIGNGEFIATFENGKTKNVGGNLKGMIRYTYFENFTLPDIGWSITNKQLLEAYQPKVQKDILSGKIKPGKHEFGKTDWIQIIK